MRRHLILFLALACGGGDKTDDGDDTGTGGDDTSGDDTSGDDTSGDDTGTDDGMPELVIEDVATGDYACLPAEGTWLSQTVDASCIATVPVDGTVEDFETGDGVVGFTVEMFFDDVIDDSPDITMTTGDGGQVTGADAPTCTAWASRVTLPGDDSQKPAIQFHWSEPHGPTLDSFYNSVSGGSIDLIAALVGIEVSATTGVAAGTFYDCGGEGSVAANVQVFARTPDGTYVDQEVRYFIDEFPNRLQDQTSEDGLWLIGELAPGDYVIEAWGIPEDGVEPRILGQTELEIFADSLSIADVYTGYGDGVVFPDSCTEACAPLE